MGKFEKFEPRSVNMGVVLTNTSRAQYYRADHDIIVLFTESQTANHDFTTFSVIAFSCQLLVSQLLAPFVLALSVVACSLALHRIQSDQTESHITNFCQS